MVWHRGLSSGMRRVRSSSRPGSSSELIRIGCGESGGPGLQRSPPATEGRRGEPPTGLPTKPASAPVDDQVTAATGDRRRGSRGHSAARESRRRYARAAFPLPARADGSWMLPCRRIKSNSRRRALHDRLVASMERKLPGGSSKCRRRRTHDRVAPALCRSRCSHIVLGPSSHHGG